MINKKLVTLGTLFLLGVMLIVIFSQNSSAVGEATVCCEKTTGTNPAWCQDVNDVNKCDSGFRSAPTSCEATSYCKLGTCVNSLEGLCMSNVPQKVCEDPSATGTEVAAGVWYDSEPSELNQCQLGCCLIGDQASFTTQARCKQLSSVYGLETNYRSDIRTETECIASATPKIKGACVFEEEFQKTCRFLTKGECQDFESSGVANVEFHANLLCSAEQLGTNCGPSKKTTVLEGRDEVWFVDTCGNPANIYSADLQDDPTYWKDIVPKALSCGAADTEGNAGSATCGNCNYFLGSTGKLYKRSRDGTPAPNFGDYICADLSCGTVDDEARQHGESWCKNSAGTSSLENAPGSRYFRKICYNGDVTVEPCADYRQEICIEDSIGDFSTAACRANKWQDCIVQDNKKDCENIDRRDCGWNPGRSILKDSDGEELVLNENDELVDRGTEIEEDLKRDVNGNFIGASCLPTHAPGFDFWKEETDAGELCLQASATCEVKFEKGLIDTGGGAGILKRSSTDYTCVENCECVGLTKWDLLEDIELDNVWGGKMNNTCIALGDCGISKNYVNTDGYYELEDLIDVNDEEGAE